MNKKFSLHFEIVDPELVKEGHDTLRFLGDVQGLTKTDDTVVQASEIVLYLDCFPRKKQFSDLGLAFVEAKED